MVTEDVLDRAERFVALNGRVLERHRFAHLFRGGPPGPVCTALAAYRNDDGGYGHALEPDGRGPGSQPVHVLSALDLLDETGALTADLAAGICDYLASVTGPDGGAPFVHPNIREHPRAPWWQITEDGRGSLLPTAALAGLLHRNGIQHPWLTGADEFCWRGIEALAATHPYEANACARFLDHVPDRDRATAQATRLGALVREQCLVALPGRDEHTPDGYADGETHQPHDYAPRPESLARQWFSDAELDASLDALAAAQHDDGGWSVSWGIWTPVTEFEWRPVVTILALRTLRAYRG